MLEVDEDPMAASRGISIGIVIGSILWMLIFVVIAACLSCRG
jgi:hypothetical protein